MNEKKKGMSTGATVGITIVMSALIIGALTTVLINVFGRQKSDVDRFLSEYQDPTNAVANDIEVTPPPYTPNLDEAWIAAKKSIEMQLDATETARYGDQRPADRVAYKGGRDYVINGWVETSKKGNVTRQKWSMRLEHTGDKEWSIMDGPHFLEPSEEDKIRVKITQKAAEQWPDDYSTQEYWINEQMQAYARMKNIPDDRIKKKAQRDWPLDFSTQEFWYKEQMAAKERLGK